MAGIAESQEPSLALIVGTEKERKEDQAPPPASAARFGKIMLTNFFLCFPSRS